jgi:hypothetical protein
VIGVANFESADARVRRTGPWKFPRWDIVDLAKFRLKLKGEFQARNRGVYRPDPVVTSSANQVSPARHGRALPLN